MLKALIPKRSQVRETLLLMGAYIAYKLSILIAWNGEALSEAPWKSLQPDCFIILFATWGITAAITLLVILKASDRVSFTWKTMKRMLFVSFVIGLASVLLYLTILNSPYGLVFLVLSAFLVSASYTVMHFVWIVFVLKAETPVLVAVLTVGQLITSCLFLTLKQTGTEVQAGFLVATCAVLYATTSLLISEKEDGTPPLKYFSKLTGASFKNPLMAGIAISTLGVGILWGSSLAIQDYRLWVFGAIAVCLIFFSQSFFRKRKVDPEPLIQSVFAMLGVAILLATIAPAWQAIFMGVVWIGYSILSLCLFLLGRNQNVQREADGNLLAVALSIFCINIALGLAIGRIISIAAPSIESPTAVAVALLLAFVFLFGNVQQRKERAQQAKVNNSNIDEAIRNRSDTFGREHHLTKAELDTLFYLVKGYTIKQTAEERFVSRNTVKSQITSIYRKLEIHSKQELLLLMDEVKKP